ncbi:SoxR reducing system RseC family protein [Aliidiomarina sp. Khilg15.8]
MIRELGQVTAVEGDEITITTQLKSGCSGCQQQNHCGAGLLSKAFPQRRGEFSLHTEQRFAVGEQVELQLPEAALARFSLAMYLLPLVALVLGAALGQALWPRSEGPAIALAALSMAGSFYLLRRYLRHRDVKVQALLQVTAAPASDA